MSRLALPLVALSSLACAAGATAPRLARVNAPVTLAVGEVASFPDEGFTLRFTGVAADSRCPADVVCVWQGDGAVLIELAPPAGDARVDTLHTGVEPRSTSVGDRTLFLEGLDPYPRADLTISRGDYRATFVLR